MHKEIEDAYPLSAAQAGMLFHSEYASESPVYHDVVSYRLALPYRQEILEKVIEQITERHEVLRTAVEMDRFSEPIQVVYREAKLPLVVEDLRDLREEDQQSHLAGWLEEEKRRGFVWNEAPFIRMYVHRLGDELLQWSLSFHHVILDGWSEATLMTELLQRYLALFQGRRLPVEGLRSRYRDYIALERK
jgi:hypothetical protein